MDRRSSVVAETTTVVALVTLALIFARPQLEGWSVIATFHDFGIFGSLALFYAGAPTRLLEPVPLGLAAQIGAPGIAVGTIYALLLALKYLIARSAVAPVIADPSAWLLATLAAVMLPWSGHWRDHNMAQELACVFLLVAVGAVIRLRSRGSILFGAIGAASVGLSLLTYEALIVCAAALPLFGLMSPPDHRRRALARCAAPVVIALGAYAVWFLLLVPGNPSSYHLSLSRGTGYADPLKALGTLYHAAYLYPAWKLAAVLCVACALEAPMFTAGRWRLAAIVLLAGLVLAPLFSLPYAVNFYFLGDPERIGLTTGFAFFLMCTVIAILAARPISYSLAGAAVAILLVAAAVNGYLSYQPYLFQRPLIDEVQSVTRLHPAPGYIVRDWTGQLGDMYTFLASTTLQDAVQASGTKIEARTCTPRGVVRSHPVLERVPAISTMAWCDQKLEVPAGSITLDIKPATDPKAHPIVELAK